MAQYQTDRGAVSLKAYRTIGFHGTNKAAADAILDAGYFSIEHSKRPPIYGFGVYFFDAQSSDALNHAIRWFYKDEQAYQDRDGKAPSEGAVLKAVVESKAHLGVGGPNCDNNSKRFFRKVRADIEADYELNKPAIEQQFRDRFGKSIRKPLYGNGLWRYISHLTSERIRDLLPLLSSIGYSYTYSYKKTVKSKPQQFTYWGIVCFESPTDISLVKYLPKKVF